MNFREVRPSTCSFANTAIFRIVAMKNSSDQNYPKAYLYRRIVQAKLYIDEHFAEPINLNDMSDTAAFSRFHFIRLFKQAYQKTPHQYLTFVRLEHAKQLMMHKNLSIADI